MKINYKLLLFYWLFSFAIAVGGYYLLFISQIHLVSNQVFAGLYRMMCYHFGNPLQYIALPVFFYGIVATVLSERFQKTKHKIRYTFLIVFLSIFLSSPFGGMLWHYHDMQAGWFPNNWINKLLGGFQEGLIIGWFIILLSIPYNILGVIVTYYLTDFGTKLFLKIK